MNDDNMNEIQIANIGATVDGLIGPMVELLLPKYAVAFSLAHAAPKVPSTIKDYLLYQKFAKFLESLHGHSKDSVKFCSQLFGDEKTARENGYRPVQYIGKVESLAVVDYIDNTSRSVGNGLIKENEYFRIFWALTNTFPEDFYFFKSIVANNNLIPENTQIIVLAQNGLMILAETDANKEIEQQDYTVTSFGMMVDRYVLSLDDNQRWEEWKKKG